MALRGSSRTYTQTTRWILPARALTQMSHLPPGRWRQGHSTISHRVRPTWADGTRSPRCRPVRVAAQLSFQVAG
jgi:hypothetical protein